MIISGDGVCDDEIEQRIGAAAARVVGAMRKEVVERRDLQKETKMPVFNAMVVSTLLYRCETWTVQRRRISKLQAFQHGVALAKLQILCRPTQLFTYKLNQTNKVYKCAQKCMCSCSIINE